MFHLNKLLFIRLFASSNRPFESLLFHFHFLTCQVLTYSTNNIFFPGHSLCSLNYPWLWFFPIIKSFSLFLVLSWYHFNFSINLPYPALINYSIHFPVILTSAFILSNSLIRYSTISASLITLFLLVDHHIGLS